MSPRTALRGLGVATCFVVLLVLSLGPFSRAACLVGEDRVTDQIVIELVPGASIDAVAARYGLTPTDSIPAYLLWNTVAAPGADIDAIVSDLNHDPDVRRAQPHRFMETPEGVQRSIGDLDFSANATLFRNQTAAQSIHTDLAHTRYTGAGTVVAVIDTAEALGHPETTSVMAGPGIDVVGGGDTAEVPANGIDDDGDGLVDESDQHGTHVAGLVHLAAPDARILAIRVLEEDGKGESFTVAKGIRIAVEHRVDVINLSFSMGHDSLAVERATEDATAHGIVVIAAAGNRALACVEFPASHADAVAVAAVTDAFVKTDYTNEGPEVDLSAPGNAVLSTWGEMDWARWSGTSFATPLVSGGAALLVEKYPGLTPAEIRSVLRSTTQPDANPPEDSGLMGTGVLDLDRLTAALTTDRTSLKLRREPGGTDARWSPVLDAAHYDLVRGDLSRLRLDATLVDLGPVQCLAEDTATTDIAGALDPVIPAPGHGFFYLFRDDAPDAGGGSYGSGSSGLPRLTNAGDCAP